MIIVIGCLLIAAGWLVYHFAELLKSDRGEVLGSLLANIGILCVLVSLGMLAWRWLP